MSQRAKRPNRSEDGSVPVKRRKRTQAEEEEAASLAAAWQPPRSNDLKSIYNRTTTEAPAELFRKDLISAMKLPDSEPLASNEYWVIVDQWKQEWERGVQVPVNPDSLPEPSVTVSHCSPLKPQHEFKLPKAKYIRITKDENFKQEEHALSSAPTQAEAACSYDLDECDVAWLKILNSERAMQALGPVSEDKLERVIEQFEVSCWDKIQSILRNEEGLGIEYDENVICDVCRSPDSEDGNEMVFCDSCNICVHQACYGITKIPEGQWLCCTCNLITRPECVLCPNKGGAMKCTRSGQKWAHVSCALWIPEVSIGCVEKMEPITKISSIPQSRWALICVLCRERVGACIQCSVKTCKTAYHVTCAFKHGLEMRAIIEDENADDGVKLRSYCEKHSKSSKKEKSVCSGSEDDDSKRKKRKDMTSEEKNQARAARLQEIEAEFYNHVSVKDVNSHLDVDSDALHYIYNYWKLKRKAGNNKPLLPPKSEDVDMLSHKREQADLEKMRMFVQLRQDLERVRNLCYMVSRREKLSRTFFRMREQTFHKQVGVLESPNLPNAVVQSVIEANHGPSIYDRLYSHRKAEDHTTDFDRILATIAGSSDSGDDKKETNGLLKDLKNNPYKKVYFNGASKRKSCSVYGSSRSSASSEDERPKNDKENRLRTSSEDEKPPLNKKKPVTSPRKSNKIAERRQKRHSTSSRCKVESSSEDDVKPAKESRSRLGQVERELGILSDNSDELMTPTRTTPKLATSKFMSSIYSDTDDTSDASHRNDDVNAASDSQQNRLRTKAAVKEFSHKPSTSKSPNKSSPENKKKSKTDIANKKKDYVPSDLIVPQRQAAKKATENLKSNTTSNRVASKEQSLAEDSSPPPPNKVEERTVVAKVPKVRPKSGKDISPAKKESKVVDIFDLDKDADNQEILAYVPQRQAAKKAAEHIKSGLGKPPAGGAVETVAVEVAKKEAVNRTPIRVADVKRTKSSSNSSSSSSTSSSSDSSSSSSSDSEEAATAAASAAKRGNVAKDRPFLDKAAKSAASSSSSDSSDSSGGPATTTTPRKKTKPKVVSDRKHVTTPSSHKEEPVRGKARPTANNNNRTGQKSSKCTGGERIGDVNVRPRDPFDSERGNLEKVTAKPCSSAAAAAAATTTPSRKGKQDELAERIEKETKPDKLQSPVGKTDKKLMEPDVPNLEKEILERRGRQGPSKTRSTLDRLFGTADKKTKPDKLKSTVKENKEPILPDKIAAAVKKSPVKTKTLDEVFTEKSISDENKIEVIPKRDEQQHVDNSVVLVETPSRKTAQEKPMAMVIENDYRKALPPKPDTHNMARSIFSPPHFKDNAFDFDNFDDGFGISKDEEIVKVPLSFNLGNTSIFKEDSKEDSARETLNLVEKLRMELSKKSTSCDVDDSVSVASSTKNDNDRNEFSEQVVPNSIPDMILSAVSKPELLLKATLEVAPPPPPIPPPTVNLEMRVEVSAPPLKHFEPDYRYLNCDVEAPNKNVPVQHHGGVNDHAAQDERWVPPSEPFPMDPSSYDRPAPFMPQYSSALHKTLPLQMVHEDQQPPAKSPPRRISQTPHLDAAASMDCMPSPSPYTDLHPQAKWADSEVIPNRRSSSSSAASTSSSCSRRNDEEDAKMRPDVVMVNHQTLEMGYLPYQPNSLDNFPPFTDSHLMGGPVSLFPPPPLNAQLSFPATGPTVFPPAFGAPFPTPPLTVMPPLPKPIDDSMPYSSTCTATFTSSQHNMALTAAMVNLPPTTVPSVKEVEPPAIVPPMPPMVSTPPCVAVATPELVPASPVVSNATTPNGSSPSIKSNSSVGKKSPSKPTRTSARVTSQLKSPNNKSPGKSPRQLEITKTTGGRGKAESRRNSVKTNATRTQSRGARGRGRGRGRNAHSQHNDFNDHMGVNTIQHKLVGTVYDLDFDDDISNDNLSNLKAMRERRKSVDVHERSVKSDYTSIKDSSESPKFSSPAHKNRYSDLKELKPPTPVEEVSVAPSSQAKSEVLLQNNAGAQIFPDMVQPVLPGPVDMRTYSNSFTSQPNYNETNLLKAFATGGTAEPQLHDEIDEDFEKELQSALATKKVEAPPPPEIGSIKASLSDSRNQLKVKIKGPIANYSNLPTIPTPTVDVSAVSNIATINNLNNSTTGTSSGTSNLRRMRKKELLRQYWTQDMNMDDSTCAPGFNVLPTVAPVNRTIITIPKAVASMTSIPTKDDYRDYRTGADDLDNVKHRKDTKSRAGALSREMKQLDLVQDDDRRNFGNNANYDTNAANKRRGRPPRPPANTTPKIKIKFGTAAASAAAAIDDKKDRVRPPKKRLATINMPSVEDLKRESMKFRRKVMADFGVEKKNKRDKGEKRKRKKSKSVVQIISNETKSNKIIIRFNKKAEGECGNKRTSGDALESGGVQVDEEGASCGGGDLKMTPIKLKLSRCQEGSGYVMKTSEQPPSAETKAEEAAQPGKPPPMVAPPMLGLSDGVPAPPTTLLPLNKDCEVR